jgi:low molecular weight phosphotyrosine protein phosphatase
MAEALFCAEVNKRGLADKWIIDSAAIGLWNIGNGPDSRAVACLAKHSLKTNHIARQIVEEDFDKFDVIFGMDFENLRALKKLKPPKSRAQVMLLGDFDPQRVQIIEDPYQGSYNDFETVYAQCSRCCHSLLDQWNSRFT